MEEEFSSSVEVRVAALRYEKYRVLCAKTPVKVRGTSSINIARSAAEWPAELYCYVPAYHIFIADRLICKCVLIVQLLEVDLKEEVFFYWGFFRIIKQVPHLLRFLRELFL